MIDQTQGFIDVHAHLLCDVDDGCRDLHGSTECARQLVAAGYTHAFCTPHVWPNYPHINAAAIRRRTSELQHQLDAARVPLVLLPAGEINLLSMWPRLQDLPPQEIVSYGLANEYVLFDFWAESREACIATLDAGIRFLRSLGRKLILAHPERVAAIQRDPPFIEWFLERGMLLQMNTWCLTDPISSGNFRLAEEFLTDGKYTFLGTDLHGPAGMGKRIEGIAVARKLVGEEKVTELMRDNPVRLLLPAVTAGTGKGAAARGSA